MQHGRRVALIGRSLITASELAHELGLAERARRNADPAAGSRAHALVRLHRDHLRQPGRAAFARFRRRRSASSASRRSKPGDTVVLSSRLIPGNEKRVYRMIDHLYRRGAKVLYGNRTPPMHVSGHASRGELQLMLNLLRPRYFVPVHGEYRQLSQHAALAEPMRAGRHPGILHSAERRCARDRRRRRAARSTRSRVGRVCIDAGTGDEIIEEMVIRDRRHLSEHGVIVPIIALNSHTGELESGPEISRAALSSGKAARI